MTTIKITNTYEEDAYTVSYIDILLDGVVVGTASAQSSESTYLVRVDVDAQYRNRGIGTAALKLIADEFDGIYLAPDNEDAQRLYNRIGREYRGEDAEYIDQGFGVYEIY